MYFIPVVVSVLMAVYVLDAVEELENSVVRIEKILVSLLEKKKGEEK